MAEQRKTYTAEFKTAAVKLITEQGYFLREAARNLGVSEKQLHQWKRSLEVQGEQAFPGKGNLPPAQEELIHDENYQTRVEARASIFEYIEVFYNRQRRHSTLGHVSPDEYEQSACPLT